MRTTIDIKPQSIEFIESKAAAGTSLEYDEKVKLAELLGAGLGKRDLLKRQEKDIQKRLAEIHAEQSINEKNLARLFEILENEISNRNINH